VRRVRVKEVETHEEMEKGVRRTTRTHKQAVRKRLAEMGGGGREIDQIVTRH